MNLQSVKYSLAVEEFKSCRSMIELNFKLIDRFENYSLAAYAGIFAWSQSGCSSDLKKFSTILLPAIVMISFLKIYGLIKAIEVNVNYQKSLEEKYKNIHWMTFYSKTNTDFSVHHARMLIAIVTFFVGIFINYKNFHY